MTPFKLTQSLYDQILAEFKEQLLKEKISDGKISYNFTFKKQKEELPTIRLYYTPKAYIKMWTLIREFTGEVGWRGTVTRLSDTEFKIEDILTFPQKVTATTVDTDEEEYANWTLELEEEDFQKLRFYGHSHVEMSTSPSATDMEERRNILKQLPENDFIIFGIFNKRGDNNVSIYDMRTGIQYDRDDIETIVMFDDNTTLFDFMQDANKKVVKEVYTYNRTNHTQAQIVQTSPAQPIRIQAEDKNFKKEKKKEKTVNKYSSYFDDLEDEYESFYGNSAGYSYPY